MVEYLIKDGNGKELKSSFKNKLEQLLESGAELIDPPKKWKEGLVYLIDHRVFGVAIYVGNEEEFKLFQKGFKDKPYQWLYLKNASKLTDKSKSK